MAVRGDMAVDRDHRGHDGPLCGDGARTGVHRGGSDRKPDGDRRDRGHPDGAHRPAVVFERNILRGKATLILFKYVKTCF